MTTKNKFLELKVDKTIDKPSEKTDKALNLSDSNESLEEYSVKELEYIDKYKPLSNYRMEDFELYELITKHNYNDEKITRDIKEYVKLIDVKGDEYGWNIVDNGKKKKLFLNEGKKTNKTEEMNETYNKYYTYQYDNQSYQTKNYKNKPYYKTSVKNYTNYTEEGENANGENQIQNQTEKQSQDTYNTNSNYYNNYYQNFNSYNSYRGGRYRRGRGYNRGRGGRYNPNYSRVDWFEKNLVEEKFENQTKEIQNTNLEENNFQIQNNINKVEVEKNIEPEKFICDQIKTDEVFDNKEVVVIKEILPKIENQEKSDPLENIEPKISEIVKNDSREPKIVETLQAEEFFENCNIISNKNIVQQVSNEQKSLSIESSDAQKLKKTEEFIKPKPNSYLNTEVTYLTVETFSFLGKNPINSNTNSNNSISTNPTISLSSNTSNNPNSQVNSNINNPASNSVGNGINFNKSAQNYSTSPQYLQINKENKFNIHNNQSNYANQIIPNQDLFNQNYQMQMNMMGQNVNGNIPQQGLYQLPLIYYPQNVNSAESSLNYSNVTPYMTYPFGYCVNPQQITQQQGNMKDVDIQNKNRKINNFDYTNQQQIPQSSQAMPYAPYFYMNSQYPFIPQNQMGGYNPGMGFNFDVNSMNQMNPNYDQQNYNPKN